MVKPPFRWDNWSEHGPLAKLTNDHTKERETILDFILDDSWNLNGLRYVLPENIVTEISLLKVHGGSKLDQPIWTITNDGLFTCKSAWQILKQSKNHNTSASKIWHKGLPFKISFLIDSLAF